MTRVLVTGATGRVGSGVVSALAGTDHAVRAATRDPDAAAARFADGTDVVAFDFARPETWGQTLDGVDRLFLVFPPAVGVDRVREFVDAAARVGVAHVTLLSVLGAEKVPVLPHRRIERHLRGSDVTWTFLRAAYFLQNLSGIHRPELVERDELFVPAGDGAFGFVDARDVSAVAARTHTEDGHANRAYDLTGATAMDCYEVASVFADVLDRPVEYANPGRIEFARRMYGRGVDPTMVVFMLAEYEVARHGLAARTTDTLARLLDRDPTSVRTFVADHRKCFSSG